MGVSLLRRWQEPDIIEVPSWKDETREMYFSCPEQEIQITRSRNLIDEKNLR